MSKTNKLKKLPYSIELPNKKKITLYMNGNNENIYYYFRFGKKSYRGSTGTSDFHSSEKEGFKIYTEVSTGKRKSGSKNSTKFEVVCKQYLKYKEENKRRKLSPRTLSEYKSNSKYLIQKFRGYNIESLCSEKVYESYQEWRSHYYKEHKTKRQIVYKRNGKVLKGRILDHVGSVPINRELRLLVSILRYSKYNLKLLQDVEIPPYSCWMKIVVRKYLQRQNTKNLESICQNIHIKLVDYFIHKLNWDKVSIGTFTDHMERC